MEVLAVSLYAFADEKRMPESKVYAADLDRDGTPEERKKDFYCPSPNCTARMRLRSKSVHCACFFALDGHSASCMYGHLGTYDPNDYNEKKCKRKANQDFLFLFCHVCSLRGGLGPKY